LRERILTMPRTAVASDDGHPWRWIGVGLAGFTVYKFATGKKVEPLVLISAVATIAAFIADL